MSGCSPDFPSLNICLRKDKYLLEQQIDALAAHITADITIDRHMQLLHDISVIQHRIAVIDERLTGKRFNSNYQIVK